MKKLLGSLALLSLGVVAFIVASLIPPMVAHAQGAAAAGPPAGIDWAFWGGLLLSLATFGSYALHAVAAKRHSARLKAVADDLDVLRSLVPNSKPALTVAPAPKTSQGGFSRLQMMLVLAAAGIALVAALACTAAQRTEVRNTSATAVAVALDCEARHLTGDALGDLRGLAEKTVQGWISGTAPSDLTALRSRVKADLALFKSDAGRCAIAGAVAAITTVLSQPGTAVSALSAHGDPAAARAAFALEARAAAWPALRVTGGAVI